MRRPCALLSSALLTGAAGVTVNTSFGKLIGTSERLQGCDQYLGIPFAKPPVGALRFEDPLPWDEAYPAEGRQATSYGANCPNQLPPGNDEDCLFLNVWRPARGPREGLAVLVFVYGGGFISGGGSASILGPVPSLFNLYDGCGFAAKQQVVVASLNYRLGALGFAAFEEGSEISSNFGMKDQRQALRWLQQELPAFGGDPAKVTLFGESAGGMSVFYHVASPVSKGLFRAAISESGFPTAWSWQHACNRTRALATHFGCTDSASLKVCLRKIPAKLLVGNETSAANPFDFPTARPPWQPVVDGVDMPRYPMTLFKERQTNQVPILAGSNTDEANLFVWPFYEKGMNKSRFEEWFAQGALVSYPIEALNDKEVAEVRAAYASPQFDAEDKRALASQIATDASFQCGTHISGQEHTTDFWLYRFNHRSTCQFWFKHFMPGVYHTAELQYVWGAQAKLACIFTPEEQALSNRMQGMWANFSKCLDPKCGGDGFPKYSNSSRKALVFETPTDRIEEDYVGDRCALWNRLVFDRYRGRFDGPPSIKQILV